MGEGDLPAPAAARGRRASVARGRRRTGALANDRPTVPCPSRWRTPRTSWSSACRATLERPVEPRLCDDATLDALLQIAYGDRDAEEVVRALREDAPELSAYRTALSAAQTAIACMLGFLLVIGVIVDVALTARVLVTMATAFFVASTGFRLYAAWKGSRPGRHDRPEPGAAPSPRRARAAGLHGAAAALQGEAGHRARALRGAVAHGLSQAQARRAAADRGRRRPHPCRHRADRPATVDARAPAAARHSAHQAAGDGHRAALRQGHARGRLRRGGQARPGPAQEGGLGLPARPRLGGLPASKARLLQPAPEPADALVHARVRRLVQHLPAGAAPHRRTDPAGRHVEPLPARGARASAWVGIRTTSPRTRTSGCASPGSG